MKLIYNEHSAKPGIYKILNTHTNRVYIGQCASFKKRWYQHQRSLLSNRHQNKFLQADFNKCKELLANDDFLEFHVLEVLEGRSKEERNLREEEHIAKWFDGGKQCYNLTKQATSHEGKLFSKSPEETRRKKSEALKGRAKSEEERRKLSLSAKARWADPEYKAKYLPLFREPSEVKRARMIGHPGHPISEEGKRRIGEATRARVVSDATRLKCSIAATGRKHSLEVRQKIAEAQHKRAVRQFALDGTVITDHCSVHEAARKVGSRATNISACC